MTGWVGLKRCMSRKENYTTPGAVQRKGAAGRGGGGEGLKNNLDTGRGAMAKPNWNHRKHGVEGDRLATTPGPGPVGKIRLLLVTRPSTERKERK